MDGAAASWSARAPRRANGMAQRFWSAQTDIAALGADDGIQSSPPACWSGGGPARPARQVQIAIERHENRLAIGCPVIGRRQSSTRRCAAHATSFRLPAVRRPGRPFWSRPASVLASARVTRPGGRAVPSHRRAGAARSAASRRARQAQSARLRSRQVGAAGTQVEVSSPTFSISDQRPWSRRTPSPNAPRPRPKPAPDPAPICASIALKPSFAVSRRMARALSSRRAHPWGGIPRRSEYRPPEYS
ncbi:unnamed protein product [Acanthosepion pharaonis]|uniref:Uncharacterized protein n=1 Tax=Acanthosepion pharaonis TaxID=158019 RepID=A0A812DE98_ACAPH|nr:unnamed protein product [Sepia pharaonis]